MHKTKQSLFLLKQRLAYAITPETEHHLVDNGEVRQFTVSTDSTAMTIIVEQRCPLLDEHFSPSPTAASLAGGLKNTISVSMRKRENERMKTKWMNGCTPRVWQAKKRSGIDHKDNSGSRSCFTVLTETHRKCVVLYFLQWMCEAVCCVGTDEWDSNSCSFVVLFFPLNSSRMSTIYRTVKF